MVINAPRREIQFLDSFRDSSDRQMANDIVSFGFRKIQVFLLSCQTHSFFNLIVVYSYIEFHQLNGIVFQINIVKEFIQTECMKWPYLDDTLGLQMKSSKNRMQSDGCNCIHLFLIYYCLYMDNFLFEPNSKLKYIYILKFRE
jgi:hypothetical protein